MNRDVGIIFLLTCEKPSALEFQFFKNSNGKVGMNGDAFTAFDDCVKPGAKKLAVVVESVVIGTVTAI